VGASLFLDREYDHSLVRRKIEMSFRAAGIDSWRDRKSAECKDCWIPACAGMTEGEKFRLLIGSVPPEWPAQRKPQSDACGIPLSR
jgi:hypothetical protein